MDHDVSLVHQIQKECIEHVKKKIHGLTKIVYFSDGCGAQYKNRKNFLNLCHHTTDFNVAAEWVFFATSHGKSPCHGIGGTGKRTATKASLQRPYKGQILTSAQLLSFRENIHGINFIVISKETMEPVCIAMNQRHQIAEKAIPGTRNFHHFILLGDKKVGIKRVSCQDHYDLV